MSSFRPFIKAFLKLLLCGHGLHLLKSLDLSLPLFPRVGDPGVLGRVLDAYGLAGGHVFLLDVQPLGTEIDLLGVGDLGDIFDLLGHHIFLGASGAAVHEGEVSRFHTGAGDLERPLRAVGHIVLGIVCRLVVLVGVDPEYREIACVAGPHPVVGVASELADRGRRGADEPHVAVDLVDEEEILVAVIQGLHSRPETLALTHGLADYRGGVLPDDRVPLGLCHGGDIAFQHLRGHILHPLEETHGQAPVRQLLALVHGPETVFEIIMLDTAVALDETVAAVMVSEQKALVGDNLPGAPASEEHDRVLQGSLVDAIDVLGG